jgi:hypothetical protein
MMIAVSSKFETEAKWLGYRSSFDGFYFVCDL